MRQIEEALARMGQVVDRLEVAVEDVLTGEDIWGTEDAELADVMSERDRLAGEVETLRARAEADAELRAEAASAVRQALTDLRGAVAAEGPRA